MKTITISLTAIMLLFPYISSAQIAEDVGAGVIDFLLSNPKSANKLNDTEAAALGVLGHLLVRSSNRKHDMNVANAGKNEMTIQGGGKEATIVRDSNGNVYILSNGVVYPISQSLITQAGGFSATAQPDGYDMAQLEKDFGPSPPRDSEWHTLTETGHYYSELPKLFLYAGYIFTGKDFNEKGVSTKVRKGKTTVPLSARFKVIKLPEERIKTILLCNWHNDIKKDGLDFSDFHGIKKKFKVNERFEIHVPVEITNEFLMLNIEALKLFMRGVQSGDITDKNMTSKERDFMEKVGKSGEDKQAVLNISIYSPFGKLVYGGERNAGTKPVCSLTLPNGLSAAGKYTILAKLNLKGRVIDTKQEEFEIIGNPNKVIKKKLKYNGNNGIFFYSGVSEKLTEYIYENLNKSEYNISQEILVVGLHIPDLLRSNATIWKSFDINGNLIGETTDTHASGGRRIGPKYNPTKDGDFIDKVQLNGSGMYRIYVKLLPSNKTFEKWVKVIVH